MKLKQNNMRYVFLYLVVLLIIGYLIKVTSKEVYSILEGIFFANMFIVALLIVALIVFLFIKHW